MRTDELDFELPPDLIAQIPADPRDDSRLMHYRRDGRVIEHRRFADLPALLHPGDLLVFNDARVLPARFSLTKPTGGHVEGLFIEELAPGQWRAMLKNVGVPKPDLHLSFLDAPEFHLQVIAKDAEGNYTVQVYPALPADQILHRVGRMPLPPYIRRDKHRDVRDITDRQRYQTVYANQGHAVAAPTAGLHFTPELLSLLAVRGVQTAYLTLNVGLGTFKPVSADRLEEHHMHVESYTIPDATAQAINLAKHESRRVIAVGTTSARVLESQPAGPSIAALTSQTGIFIYPPYRWKHVDCLITNFHLPRSTLIALVAAMVGMDQQRALYALAIEERYRFFSYGDAMFIE